MGKPILSERLFQKFYLLNHYSKLPLLKPVKSIINEVVCKYLHEEVFHVCGVYEWVMPDNGEQFKSRLFKALLMAQ